ncbi:MAG: hypothetical protein KC731_36835 [Myxococcales bacterium]|nr:hypothetical protein [Myxococcales bacterium]
MRVETPPADELQPGPGAEPTGHVERRADGTLTPAGAQVLGRLAGKRSAQRRKLAAQLADQLGLEVIPDVLKPYIDAAREFATAQMVSLGMQFGELGPGPASAVHSAALALAASRAAYAEGDTDRGDKLAASSSQQLLKAHHLADVESKARAKAPGASPLAALTERLTKGGKHG